MEPFNHTKKSPLQQLFIVFSLFCSLWSSELTELIRVLCSQKIAMLKKKTSFPAEKIFSWWFLTIRRQHKIRAQERDEERHSSTELNAPLCYGPATSWNGPNTFFFLPKEDRILGFETGKQNNSVPIGMPPRLLKVRTLFLLFKPETVNNSKETQPSPINFWGYSGVHIVHNETEPKHVLAAYKWYLDACVIFETQELNQAK